MPEVAGEGAPPQPMERQGSLTENISSEGHTSTRPRPLARLFGGLKSFALKRFGRQSPETALAELAGQGTQAAESDTKGSEPLELDITSEIGEAPYLGTTVVGIEHLFPTGAVTVNGQEHVLTPEDMRLLREQQERKTTEATRARMHEMARQRLENEPVYDFSTQPELREMTEIATEAARTVLAERLTAHDLSEEDVTERTAHLQPHYFAGLPNIKDGAEKEANDGDGRQLAGEVNTDGLICVYPDSTPQRELRPFWTLITTAHEMSHGAMGQRAIIGLTDQDDTYTIIGLDRQNASTLRHEGGLLENAFAEVDAARTYAHICHEQAGNDTLRPIIENQRYFVHGITSETTRELQTNPESAASREDYLPIYERVLAARNLGIPTEWIESHVPMVGSEGLDQIVMLWKLARMIGYQRTPEAERASMSQEQFVEQGLYFLEECRIQGTDDAHKQIREIFGQDADKILLPRDHPTQDERESILRLVRAREEQMNAEWIRQREEGESELY